MIDLDDLFGDEENSEVLDPEDWDESSND